VAQLAVSDLTGEGFAELMRRTVLEPLQMSRSSYEQPLPDEKRADAAVGHNREGLTIRGLWRIHPELAAAGLWTTPSDLARFVIEMQLSLAGRSNRVLSRETTRLMLTVDELGRDIGEGDLEVDYALGFALFDHGKVFAHSGSNVGFKVVFMATRESGKGIVLMSNGDSGPALLREVGTAVRNVYGWP
jgi:CubicO group peptidase (beta-lactamase class C family)